MENDRVVAYLDLEPETETFEDVGKVLAAWFEDNYEPMEELAVAIAKICVMPTENELGIFLGSHVKMWLPLDRVEELIAASRKS
jgi:hypothetical protein